VKIRCNPTEVSSRQSARFLQRTEGSAVALLSKPSQHPQPNEDAFIFMIPGGDESPCATAVAFRTRYNRFRSTTNLMKKHMIAAAIFAYLVFPLTAQDKGRKNSEIFEATVARVEPWGPIKISCGVAIVYRMAEYRVDTVLRGHLHHGEQIVVRHLACNGNELDDLKPGDQVVVFADELRKHERKQWMTYKVTGEVDAKCLDKGTERCFEARFAPGETVLVRFGAEKVAKLIYSPIH
jgi:hypothetical protein